MKPEHVLIKKLICENVLTIETPVLFFERHPQGGTVLHLYLQ